MAAPSPGTIALVGGVLLLVVLFATGVIVGQSEAPVFSRDKVDGLLRAGLPPITLEPALVRSACFKDGSFRFTATCRLEVDADPGRLVRTAALRPEGSTVSISSPSRGTTTLPLRIESTTDRIDLTITEDGARIDLACVKPPEDLPCTVRLGE